MNLQKGPHAVPYEILCDFEYRAVPVHYHICASKINTVRACTPQFAEGLKFSIGNALGSYPDTHVGHHRGRLRG